MTSRVYRADSRPAPSQWETLLQSNAVSHWLGANLESALSIYSCSEFYFWQNITMIQKQKAHNNETLLHSAGGHQGSHKAHQAGNQIYIRLWTHKSHSILRPHRRAMEWLLWAYFWGKMFTLSRLKFLWNTQWYAPTKQGYPYLLPKGTKTFLQFYSSKSSIKFILMGFTIIAISNPKRKRGHFHRLFLWLQSSCLFWQGFPDLAIHCILPGMILHISRIWHCSFNFWIWLLYMILL